MRYRKHAIGYSAAWLLAVTLPAGTSAGPFLEPDVEVLYALLPSQPGGGFGFAAENIGDIDDDGVADLIVSAPQDFAGGPFAGRAFVYSGAGGAPLNTVSGDPLEFLGTGVAAVGDVDGDGVPDYAVGAAGLPPMFGSTPGRVVAISGADHTVIHETVEPAGGRFGFDINSAGDVNGDGRPDIIVGVPFDDSGGTDAGQVRILSGPDGSEVWSRAGANEGDALGGAVSGLPDLNGDGIPEQVVGAFNAGPAQGGAALVLSGLNGSLLSELSPLPTAVEFGQFFAHDAGDVDADGLGDIYIGDFADSRLGPLTGRGYVFSGADRTPIRIFDGERADDGFGIGRSAGDINGDGHSDLFLAAFRSDDGAANAGKAYLFSGRDGGVIRTYTGTAENVRLGFDAVPMGDVNRDGVGDYLITGVDIAFVVAGTDSSPRGRTDSLCELIRSIPVDAFSGNASDRKKAMCNKLEVVATQLETGASGARHMLENDVQARMDGTLGGNPENDWIIDDFWQRFLDSWLDGLIRLATAQ
jgi:hypothetical protein